MNLLQESWSSFSADVARGYLRGFGAPSEDSKRVLADVLLETFKGRKPKLIELGCGNGHLAGYFRERGLDFHYTGVDFSEPLLNAGRQAYADDSDVDFINDDVHELSGIKQNYDYAIYSHVIEMLPSPELSLRSARNIANGIIIRFFEPPEADVTTVDLRNLETGGTSGVAHPYIRWTLGKDYYRLILANLGASRVDVYRTNSKDQVHVLHFD